MSSASKTLELYSRFSAARVEIGLSQFCRPARRDKAKTYRHLQAHEETGFVEQNPISKRYRLGPVFTQLAQMRAATVPLCAVASVFCALALGPHDLINAATEKTLAHIETIAATIQNVTYKCGALARVSVPNLLLPPLPIIANQKVTDMMPALDAGFAAV